MGSRYPKRALGVVGLCASLVLAACGRPDPATGAQSANRVPAAPGASGTTTTGPPLRVDAVRTATPATAARRRSSALRRLDAPPPIVFRRAVSAAAPLRVGYIGDSVAFSLLPSLGNAGADIVARYHLPIVFAGGFEGPGFGLTADVPGHNDVGPTAPTSAFQGWRDSVTSMVVQPDPDVVLVLLGTWDTIERDPDGHALHPGTPEWTRWYGMLADQFVKMLTARGASVVWMLMPCIGRPDVNERLKAVNGVLEQTWRVAPGRVGYVNLSEAACHGDTPIYKFVGPWGPVDLRMPDGVHFSPATAPLVMRPFLVRKFSVMLQPLLRASARAAKTPGAATARS